MRPQPTQLNLKTALASVHPQRSSKVFRNAPEHAHRITTIALQSHQPPSSKAQHWLITMGVQRHPVNPIHTPMIGLPGQKRPRHARPAKANTAGSLDATLIRASHAMPRTRPTEPTVSCNPGTQRTQLQRTWVAYGSNSF